MVATTPVSWPRSSNIWVVRITTSPLHAIAGMQPDRAVGCGGRLVQTHQDPASGFAQRALEDFLAVFPEHLPGGHAEQFLRGPIDSCYAELRVVQNQSIGKLVEHRFQDTGLLPAWSEL